MIDYKAEAKLMIDRTVESYRVAFGEDNEAAQQGLIDGVMSWFSDIVHTQPLVDRPRTLQGIIYRLVAACGAKVIAHKQYPVDDGVYGYGPNSIGPQRDEPSLN